MGVERFTGEVKETGQNRGFSDFQVFDHIVFQRDDGSTLKLENSIGVPVEMSEVFKPGLRGDFLTYSVPMGRRGVFAIRPKGGTPSALFKVPGEGMYFPMAIVCLITVVLLPLAIILYVQHTNTQKTKREGEAAYATF